MRFGVASGAASFPQISCNPLGLGSPLIYRKGLVSYKGRPGAVVEGILAIQVAGFVYGKLGEWMTTRLGTRTEADLLSDGGGDALPEFGLGEGIFELSFVRLKTSEDPGLQFILQEREDLSTGTWGTSDYSVLGNAEGVCQDNLPDGQPVVSSQFERIRFITTVSQEAGRKTFYRILVSYE